MRRSPRFVVLALFVESRGGQVLPPGSSAKQIRNHAHDRLALKGDFFGKIFCGLREGTVNVAQNQDPLNFLGRELGTRCGVFTPIGKIPGYGILINTRWITLVQSLVVTHADGTSFGPFTFGLNLPQSFEGIAVSNGSIFPSLQKWFHGISTGHYVGLNVGLVASSICHYRSTQAIDNWRSTFVIVYDFRIRSPDLGIAQRGICFGFFAPFLFLGWQRRLHVLPLVFFVQIGLYVNEVLSLFFGKFLRLCFRILL
mmetsp:Transcript_13739/g.38685  ORF Transcript_13739/g.38685 Transcript_13739/m.38685 type:complete len:255 (+) Transcript_13739:966-1730(+)